MTDENGQVIEENETPQEEPAASNEKTTEEEVAQGDTPAESEAEETPPEADEDEIVTVATDESGEGYVPISRFKKVYGKGKAAERENEELKTEIQRLKSQGYTPKQAKQIAEAPIDKTDKVEIELLRATLPQFNPESDIYSKELDQMGFDKYKANPGITRIEAAKMALETAKQLRNKVAKIEEGARTVKSQQSDQGITSRVSSHKPTSDVPGEDASDEEMEKWLRAKGKW